MHLVYASLSKSEHFYFLTNCSNIISKTYQSKNYFFLLYAKINKENVYSV